MAAFRREARSLRRLGALLLGAAALLLAFAAPAEASHIRGLAGAVPAPGSVGLLVLTTGFALDGADLADLLEFNGCAADSIAVLQRGAWRTYIPGAPGVVNASVPATLVKGTPFYVRCGARAPDAAAAPQDEVAFVEGVIEAVFRNATFDGLRQFEAPSVLAVPGHDATLATAPTLLGPVRGEYVLVEYERGPAEALPGSVVPANAPPVLSNLVVGAEFERGIGAIFLAIAKSPAGQYQVWGWAVIPLS